MKRAVIVIVIALVLLGIVGLILFKLFSPSSPNAPAQVTTQSPFPNPTTNSSTAVSPASFTEDLYRWYLPKYTQVPPYSQTQAFSTNILNWVTPEFAASWQQMIDDTGEDPILRTQDYQNSWNQIQTSIATQTASDATVLVTLGSGTETHLLRVGLVQTPAGWRVSSVTRAN